MRAIIAGTLIMFFAVSVATAEEHAAPPPIETLNKEVRLTFRLVPSEHESKPLSVTVATETYAIAAQSGNEDRGFHFEIGGNVFSKGEDSLLLTFDLQFGGRGKDGEASFAAAGSTMIDIGSEKTVAELGEKFLIVAVHIPK